MNWGHVNIRTLKKLTPYPNGVPKVKHQTKGLLNLDQFDLFIWDFDRTLLHPDKVDLLKQTNNTELFITDIIDYQFFQRLIEKLVTMGKRVAIASFGDKQLILTYMDMLFGPNNPFNTHNVITPSNFPPFKDGQSMGNKNRMLDHIRKDTSKNRTIFFDDTLHNAITAVRAGYSHAIHAQPFTRDLWYTLFGSPYATPYAVTLLPADEFLYQRLAKAYRDKFIHLPSERVPID